MVTTGPALTDEMIEDLPTEATMELVFSAYAETTAEFDQWCVDYNISPVTVTLDNTIGILLYFADERDLILFKLKWQ